MESFKKILFPTDFSKGADHALQHALRMVDVVKGEVVVQHVVRTYFEKHSHWTTLFDIHEMQKYMDMYVDTEMARVTPQEVQGDITFRNVISEGKPAQQIVDLAEKEKADLIVMGPATGAVTGGVVRASTRPVLAVPQTGNGNGVEPLRKVSTLLVGTDFSSHSKKIVDYAFELKKFFDCDLYLLHAIELTNAIRHGISVDYFTDALSKMHTFAENQLKNLTPHELIGDSSVHYLVEEGRPADMLTQCAETHDIDMVILGAHGYGPVQQYFVGKTIDKVLRNLERPILTVKI